MNGKPWTWFVCDQGVIYDADSMWDYLWAYHEDLLKERFLMDGMTDEQFDARVMDYCEDLMIDGYDTDEYDLLDIEPVAVGYGMGVE